MEHMAVDSFGAHTATSARALADAGIRCALRYHYSATSDEVRVLHDHGISFCLIGEFDTATWHPPLHNPETGADHARKTVAAAHRLGIPPGGKLTLTVDTMVWPNQLDGPRRYFELAAPIIRDAGYLVEAYGGSFVIDDLVHHGLADTSWEAGARTWSSPTGHIADYQPSRTATLRQLVDQPWFGGVQTDLNVFLKDPVGEWMPDGTVGPAPIHIVTPSSEDDHMDTLIVDAREGRLSAWLLSGRHKTWIPTVAYGDLFEAAAHHGNAGDVKVPPDDQGGILQSHGSPWIGRMDLAVLTNPDATPEHLGGRAQLPATVTDHEDDVRSALGAAGVPVPDSA